MTTEGFAKRQDADHGRRTRMLTRFSKVRSSSDEHAPDLKKRISAISAPNARNRWKKSA